MCLPSSRLRPAVKRSRTATGLRHCSRPGFRTAPWITSRTFLLDGETLVFREPLDVLPLLVAVGCVALD